MPPFPEPAAESTLTLTQHPLAPWAMTILFGSVVIAVPVGLISQLVGLPGLASTLLFVAVFGGLMGVSYYGRPVRFHLESGWVRVEGGLGSRCSLGEARLPRSGLQFTVRRGASLRSKKFHDLILSSAGRRVEILGLADERDEIVALAEGLKGGRL